MSMYSCQYYLVIRPLSEDPARIEPYLGSLADLTGLDQLTLKKKCVGCALQILKHGEGKITLERISELLKDKGITSSVISQDEVDEYKSPDVSSYLEISQKSLTFKRGTEAQEDKGTEAETSHEKSSGQWAVGSQQSSESPHEKNENPCKSRLEDEKSGEALFTLDGKSKCLIVLATMELDKLQGKRVSGLLINSDNPLLPLEDMLTSILRHDPVMDIYFSPSGAPPINPIRIDSTAFDYTCLADKNRYSASLNFPVIIEELSKFSSSIILDTGFGESQLPFLNFFEKSGREELMQEFLRYSHFVSLACQKGLYNIPLTTGGEKSPEISLIKGMKGVQWAGPLFLLGEISLPGKEEITRNVGKMSTEYQAQKASLELPISIPEKDLEIRNSKAYSPGEIYSWVAGERNFFKRGMKFLESLGPSMLLYPLIIIVFISLGLANIIERPEPLSLGSMAFGLILFIHSFVLLKRKRIIENCPTSKIRSMPMGQVEIKGYARQKYILKSPYTFTDCVYYSYKIYRKVESADGRSSYKLKEKGNSSRIPFYLEDNTARVLVLPQEAVIDAGVKQTIWGDPQALMLGIKSAYPKGSRIIEEIVIPVNYFLYVMGFARPMRASEIEKKKKMLQKLRILKGDKRSLKKYDLDHDGKISREEWEMARNEIEEEVLLEEPQIREDTVALGAPPAGGLFYISDKQEERILSSMKWKIPIFFILGVAVITKGFIYFLKLVQNRELMLAIKNIFWP